MIKISVKKIKREELHKTAVLLHLLQENYQVKMRKH